MKPSIKSHLRIEYVGDDQVFLIGDQTSFFVQGRACALIVPLLDGTRTAADIIRELGSAVSPPEIYYVIEQLKQAGHLSDGRNASPQASYFSAQGVDARAALARLMETYITVNVVTSQASDLGAEAMIGALERAGMRIARNGQPSAAVRVVMTDDYLTPALRAHGRRAAAQGERWMLIKPVGAVPWFGPIFGPAGPCWACLAQRVSANRAVEQYVTRQQGTSTPLTPPIGYMEASVHAAANLAALAVAQWVAQGGKGWLDETLVSMNLAEMTTERHPVVRLPQCEDCGDPEQKPHDARERPLILTSRPKGADSNSGQRIVTAQATYEHLRKHISPITGLISEVKRKREDEDEVMPLYTAVHPGWPVGRASKSADFARTSWGKGTTAAESRTSAMCEALERLSARFRGDEPRVSARLEELAPLAVSPDRIVLFSERQYQMRAEINAKVTEPRREVPARFDPAWTVEWTPAWSLTHNELRYVPTALCYDDYNIADQRRFSYFHANGHAAGNCLEEAILQGFLELCERDSVALWWYNGLSRPCVDLDSFDDPYLVRSQEHYRRLGRRMWVLDLTADLDIPAFAALAMNDEETRVAIGFGCHVNAHQGVRRAVTELMQIFTPSSPDRPAWKNAVLREQPYLYPAPGPMRRAEDFRNLGCPDVSETVSACVARAAERGLDTIVLDQTRPDFDISVAKVIVPGMRHFWPELGPGRLYQVPVELGWLSRPYAESELNPMPIFW